MFDREQIDLSTKLTHRRLIFKIFFLVLSYSPRTFRCKFCHYCILFVLLLLLLRVVLRIVVAVVVAVVVTVVVAVAVVVVIVDIKCVGRCSLVL